MLRGGIKGNIPQGLTIEETRMASQVINPMTSNKQLLQSL